MEEAEKIIESLNNQFVEIVTFAIDQYDKHFLLVIKANRKNEIKSELYRIRIVPTDNAGKVEIKIHVNLQYISPNEEIPEIWPNYMECHEWFKEWVKRYYDKL